MKLDPGEQWHAWGIVAGVAPGWSVQRLLAIHIRCYVLFMRAVNVLALLL